MPMTSPGRQAALARAILTSATDFAIVTTSLEGNVTSWNPGAEHLLGWSANEMMGETACRFFTPEDIAAGRCELEMDMARETGRCEDERWHMKKDGSRLWASGLMMRFEDEGSGEHIGYLKILRDRTPQHEANRRLAESEAHWRGLFERLQEGLIIGELIRGTDGCVTDWRYLDVNAAWSELVGVPGDAAIGRTIRELIPDIEEAWITDAAVAVAEDQTVSFTRQVGSFARWYEGRIHPLERDRFTILFQEVTERYLVERRRDALLELGDRTRDELDPVAMTAIGAEIIGRTLDVGRVGYGNVEPDGETFVVARDWTAPGFPSLAGTYCMDDYGGYAEDLRRGDIVRIPDIREDPRTQATAATLEAVNVRALLNLPVKEQGRTVAILYVNTAVPRSWTDDELAFVRNVAERLRQAVERRVAEARLKEMNDTLEQRVAQRTAELMESEERLRQSQKMEAVGQLTGGLAHDFNNLLTGITGSLEMMTIRIGQGRMGDVEKYNNAAQGAAKRAAALTHRLLAFSRRQTLDPKPTQPNRLIEGMLDLVQRTVGPEVDARFVPGEELWTTLVDPNQLENALLNLCINARDAMPGGGKLTIETNNRTLDARAAQLHELEPGRYVALCVSDSGTGMTPEVIEKAFDPFFTTKPIGVGTGLGLSMIYGFARQSAGHVRIYSEVGEGTTVCIYLPRHWGEAEVDQDAAGLSDAPRAERGETVLVVDDEPSVRMLVTDVLEELGYTAIEAVDGAAGLKVLQSDARIDLLVSDVGLPGGMNGRQMADAARVGRPDLKVLFITGYAENAVVGNGHLDPGMHVMTKPFAMEALATRIRTLIEAG